MKFPPKCFFYRPTKSVSGSKWFVWWLLMKAFFFARPAGGNRSSLVSVHDAEMLSTAATQPPSGPAPGFKAGREKGEDGSFTLKL